MMESRGRDEAALEELDDGKLIAASRDGDVAAFGELWRRHSAAALAVARPLAFSDAEDVVADAFESMWEQLTRGLGPREHFRAYAFTVVRNVAARRYQVRRRTVTGVDLEGETVGGGDEALLFSEDNREILAAFRSLPERWQQTLWWLEVEGLPRTEVSRRLELSPNSVSVLARRAKEGLRLAWMREQLPPITDESHRVALEALPKYVRGGQPQALRRQVRRHLAGCASCAAAESQLRAENRRLGGKVGGSLLVLALGGTAFGAAWEPSPAAADTLDGSGRIAGGALEKGAHAVGPLSIGAPAWFATVGVSAALLGAVALLVLPRLFVEPPAVPETAQPTTSAEQTPGAEQTPEQETPKPERGSEDADDAETPEARSDREDPTADDTDDTDDTTTETPRVDGGTFTASSAGSDGGRFAPMLSGAGAPGSSVQLTVGGFSYSVPVSGDGRWASDLSTLDLPSGPHRVEARQAASGWSPAMLPFDFSIDVPRLTVLGALAQSDGSRSTAVAVTGSAGGEVCVALGPGIYQRFALDASGRSEGSVPLSGGSGAALEYRYCSGDRFGAIAHVAVL